MALESMWHLRKAVTGGWYGEQDSDSARFLSISLVAPRFAKILADRNRRDAGGIFDESRGETVLDRGNRAEVLGGFFGPTQIHGGAAHIAVSCVGSADLSKVPRRRTLFARGHNPL